MINSVNTEFSHCLDSDRIAEYDMKLMDIDSDTLGIPDTDYDARVTMRASEFSRIVRDLSLLGESVRIEVTKEGIRFTSDGEAANGNVLLKQTEAARERYADYGKEDEELEGEAEDDEDGKKKKTKVKKERVKKEERSGDVDMEEGNDDEEEFKVKSDDEGEEENADEEDSPKKKRKKSSGKVRTLFLVISSSTEHLDRAANQPREPKNHRTTTRVVRRAVSASR